MNKKTETINKFRTTKVNVDFIKKLQSQQEFEVSIPTIVETLLTLGIQQFKLGKRIEKEDQ